MVCVSATYPPGHFIFLKLKEVFIFPLCFCLENELLCKSIHCLNKDYVLVSVTVHIKLDTCSQGWTKKTKISSSWLFFWLFLLFFIGHCCLLFIWSSLSLVPFTIDIILAVISQWCAVSSLYAFGTFSKVQNDVQSHRTPPCTRNCHVTFPFSSDEQDQSWSPGLE